MDKITGYSNNELLVKILSFLPTKDAIRTSVLSKQWRFLWKRVPKLDFYEFCDTKRSGKLKRFINWNLPSHRAPILETLNLNFTTLPIQPYDIESWVRIAVSRYNLRNLTISFFNPGCNLAKLPISLYSSKSLVSLKLDESIFVDAPRVVHLPSLKTLHLRRVLCNESLTQILSNCPVLEDLLVELRSYDRLRNFKVIVPSLQSLSIKINANCEIDEFVIDTPSLKYLKVEDYSDGYYSCLIKNMPQLEEAEIDVENSLIPKFLRSIRSINQLSLTVQHSDGEDLYNDETVFNELEVLKIFTPKECCFKSFHRWIRHSSPKLRGLEVYKDKPTSFF